MSLQVFMLPDLGEGLTEAELVTWLVGVGDAVHVDQPVAELETAKSVVEVPSPFEGVVATLHGAEGETLAVGKPLISIRAETPVVEPVETQTPVVEPVETDFDKLNHREPVETDFDKLNHRESGHVLIGYGTSGEAGPGRTRAPRKPVPAAPANHAPEPAAPLVVSPIVRKLAHDHGLALAAIRGTGPDGLILRSDVDAAIRATEREPGTRGGDVVVVHPPTGIDQRTGLGVRARTPLTGMQRAAVAAFSRSRREIPEATVWVDVDATKLLNLRRKLKERDGTAPGLLAFVARFATAGLARYPQLNRQFTDTADGGELTEFDGVNLGFAAQTDRGLVVPVLRGVQGLGARELDARIRELAGTARAGKAGPALLSGGTFTINNYGVFGVDGSAAIINHPEAAMLGLGRIMPRPWVVGGRLRVRQVAELTLAFDHRVCDGEVAAGFLRFVADAMENPTAMLAEL
ncbi:dihydrolipoamide acetyltransferase family protein [Specibacter cremeus]|uniref:dihydrolipoamide acetyltransferase family protein n=1 Tax=Specibacter cremeus TaxID=1629051 RepID=UPI000F77927F|nr:dihydrolipoamide acetyltransferase family protein [Specibacter cremeus]